MRKVIEVVYWNDLDIVMRSPEKEIQVRLCARSAGLLYALCLFEFRDGSLARPGGIYTIEISTKEPKGGASCPREVEFALTAGRSEDSPASLHTVTNNGVLVFYGDLTEPQQVFLQRLLGIATNPWQQLHTYLWELSHVGEDVRLWVRVLKVKYVKDSVDPISI